MKKYLFALLLCITMQPSKASSPKEALQEADDAFQKMEYQKAISILENLDAAYQRSVEVNYNLGTAYLKLDNLGKARLHLERAALIAPNDNDIKNNLSVLNDKIQTTVIPLKGFFLKEWWLAISNTLQPISWAIVSLFMGLLILVFLYFFWFRLQKKRFTYGVVISIILLMLSVLAGLTRYQYLYQSNWAVVMQTTTLKNSANASSEDLKTLTSGVKLTIHEQFNDWVKVSTMDLEEGWIASKSIERI